MAPAIVRPMDDPSVQQLVRAHALGVARAASAALGRLHRLTEAAADAAERNEVLQGELESWQWCAPQ
eukprot:3500464-Pyramimonas_sp.AAC.1